MRSRSRLAALLIATGLLAVAAWWFLIPHQPGYQGKSFSRLLKDVDFGGRRGAAARAAIREIGTNSLPALARYLTHHDSSLERRWFAFTRKYGVGVEWFEDDFQWHRRAALALGELGLVAEPALPTLAQAVTNSQAPEQVAGALSKLLPKSIGVLTNALVTCGSRFARAEVFNGLVQACSYQESAATSLSALKEALRSQNLELYNGAEGALIRIREGNYATEVREAASQVLKNPPPRPQDPLDELLNPGTNQIPSRRLRLPPPIPQ